MQLIGLMVVEGKDRAQITLNAGKDLFLAAKRL